MVCFDGQQPSEEYAMAKDKEFWAYMSGRADGYASAMHHIKSFLFPEDQPKEMSEGVKLLMEASMDMYFEMRDRPKVFEHEDMVL